MDFFPAFRKTKPACHHPLVRKAYYLGLPGEGYVCVACGEARPPTAAKSETSDKKR